MTAPSDREHLAAGHFLASRGLYGLVWLDADLVARRRFGDLAGFVPLGAPVTEAVAPLVGLGDKIRALEGRRDERSVALPNVQVDARNLEAPRLNLAVFWLPESSEYLLLIARAASRHDLENMITAQVRLRQMAEAEIAAQKLELERLNEELQRANADLGAFASIISHDLSGPLRAMRYYTDEAAKAVGTGDTATAHDNMGLVQRQSRRMSHMLTGLLEYSRIGRKTEIAEEIDTGALAREIAEATARPSGIAIIVDGDWPVLTTLSQPLDIVLRNLVGNAVKHHDRGEGTVRVSAADAGAAIAIEIADDGPGIAPEWHEAIFHPFKRIGDEDDPATPEGAGLGLALVRKTLEVVGGTIAVVSDPARGRGTTFRLTWPKSIEV